MHSIGVQRLSHPSGQGGQGSAIAAAVQEQVFEFEGLIAELKDQKKFVSYSFPSLTQNCAACEIEDSRR